MACPTSSSASATGRTTRASPIRIRPVHPCCTCSDLRNKTAPGGAVFVPELAHNRSGAGTQILTEDINKDGRIDIVTSGAHGVYVFFGNRKTKAAAR